jgi:hypothetical protein
MSDEIKDLIKDLTEEAGDYANGHWVEDAECMRDIEYDVVQDGLVLDQRRWSNLKESVIKIGGRYIAFSWDDPATEQQDGQNTDIEFYEVEPHEKVTVEYKAVKTAKKK